MFGEELNGGVHFFFNLRPEIFFGGKLGQKNQNCPFKLKFGSYIWWRALVLLFSVSHQKNHFGVNLVQKFEIVCLRRKFAPPQIIICRI